MVDSDDGVAFIFQQYGRPRLADIKLFVEVVPINTIQPLWLWQTNPNSQLT